MSIDKVDLRSDTVTRPCEQMMHAMQNAEVGDDVYEEDPTVIELQDTLSRMTGHEAGLFFPSGVQSNLVALLTHLGRGDEYIVAQNAHTYKYEGGGAAALGGIQPQPIEEGADGVMDLNKVEAAIKADDIHFAKTRLLALENTTGGLVVSMDYMQSARDLATSHGLQFHLDGARVFNAAVALDKPVGEITSMFDTVSICLSKGLGAPVGSVLVGSESFINLSKRWRKTVGGGMRQSGILAAAGLYAIHNNVQRLSEDHALASYLTDQLRQFADIDILRGGVQTNMVFFNLKSGRYDELLEFSKSNGVLFGGRQPVRMVTHKDISREHIDIAIERLSRFFG
jgi:threonine aldolase